MTIDVASINWSELIPMFVLQDESFASSFAATTVGDSYLVKRSDSGGDYYIVTFNKNEGGQTKRLASAAVIIDAQKGVFREAAASPFPADYTILSEREAIQAVLKHIQKSDQDSFSSFRRGRPPSSADSAELVWKAGSPISSSPFDPYWIVTAGGARFYVTRNGSVYAS
jgi:hypothetical protein